MPKTTQFITEIVTIDNPDSKNFIIGQSHFIKTIEDIYEVIVSTVPGAKFGVAFSEASGPCLVRSEGTSPQMIKLAVANLQKIASGHVFVIFIDNFFPINILNALKNIPQITRIYCATANPVQVLVYRTGQGGGIAAVIDGSSPKGVENAASRRQRVLFLRKIGYKLK